MPNAILNRIYQHIFALQLRVYWIYSPLGMFFSVVTIIASAYFLFAESSFWTYLWIVRSADVMSAESNLLEHLNFQFSNYCIQKMSSWWLMSFLVVNSNNFIIRFFYGDTLTLQCGCPKNINYFNILNHATAVFLNSETWSLPYYGSLF